MKQRNKEHDGRKYRPRCEECGVFLSYEIGDIVRGVEKRIKMVTAHKKSVKTHLRANTQK